MSASTQLDVEDITDPKHQLELFHIHFKSSVDPACKPIRVNSMVLWNFSRVLLQLADAQVADADGWRVISLAFPPVVMDVLGSLMWNQPVIDAVAAAELTAQVSSILVSSNRSGATVTSGVAYTSIQPCLC